ncbi:MAG: hypothetical protein INH34_19240 [Phycisphaerales bacterium]|jgi:hypothetical protein|nr:hypothetical protein [Phycisphaerales bacterium]
MNKPLLDAIGKPLLAMLGGLTFGVPCVRLGCQTLRIGGQKDPAGTVAQTPSTSGAWCASRGKPGTSAAPR